MKRCFFLILMFSALAIHVIGQNNKLTRGFLELEAKNYGLSFQHFRALNSKYSSISNYGFACLYGNTSEFEHVDSAIYYLSNALQSYDVCSDKLSRNRRDDLQRVGWDDVNMQNMLHFLYARALNQLQEAHDVEGLSRFISNTSDLTLQPVARDFRDSLWLARCDRNSMACLLELKICSPKTTYMAELNARIEEVGFKRWVAHGTEDELSTYILYHPRSAYKRLAEDELFHLYLEANDTLRFKYFITHYPKNQNVDKIWRAFYQLSAGNYDPQRMRWFIEQYPTYPFASSVQAELRSFGKELYPYASREGMMGYMDEHGAPIIPASYDWVGEFREGLAVVMLGDKYGVINKQGQVHISVMYDFISDFHNGYSIFELNAAFGLFNRAGIVVINNEYADLEWAFGDLLVYEREGMKGLMKITGDILCLPSFDEINPVNEILAIVKRDGFAGVINSSLMEIVPVQFDQVMLSDKQFIVSKAGLKGLYDVYGKELLSVDFDGISEEYQGFRVVKKGQQFSHLNCKNWHVSQSWNEAYSADLLLGKRYKGQWLVRKKSKYLWVDTVGKLTKLFNFYQMNSVSEVLSGVKDKNGKIGFWDRNGVELTPFHFDYVEHLRNDQYVVKMNEKMGVYSEKGVLLIPAEFDEITPWLNGQYYMVQRGTKKGIFTKAGVELLPPEYDLIKEFVVGCWMIKKESQLLYYFPDSKRVITNN
jgi:hypothetical protein